MALMTDLQNVASTDLPDTRPDILYAGSQAMFAQGKCRFKKSGISSLGEVLPASGEMI
jgi:hypothetical protein